MFSYHGVIFLRLGFFTVISGIIVTVNHDVIQIFFEDDSCDLDLVFLSTVTHVYEKVEGVHVVMKLKINLKVFLKKNSKKEKKTNPKNNNKATI